MELSAPDSASAQVSKGKMTVQEFGDSATQLVSDYVAYGLHGLAESATQKIHRRPDSALLKQKAAMEAQYTQLRHKYSHLKKNYRRLREKYHSIAHQPSQTAAKRRLHKTSSSKKPYKDFAQRVQGLVGRKSLSLPQLYHVLHQEVAKHKQEKALLQTYARLLSRLATKLNTRGLRSLAQAIDRL